MTIEMFMYHVWVSCLIMSEATVAFSSHNYFLQWKPDTTVIIQAKKKSNCPVINYQWIVALDLKQPTDFTSTSFQRTLLNLRINTTHAAGARCESAMLNLELRRTQGVWLTASASTVRCHHSVECAPVCSSFIITVCFICCMYHNLRSPSSRCDY